MKLYMHPVSMMSRPVMLFAAQESIPLENVVVDLMTGEHHQEPYAQINPSRLVPTLDDEGFVLTESSAILKYLAEKKGSPTYPSDLRAKARVNEAMDWVNTNFYRDFGYNLCYPQVFAHHARQNDEVQQKTLEWGAEKARFMLGVLDDHLLADRDWIAGDDITIADYFMAGPITLGETIHIDYARWPNVKAWLDRMKGLEHWDAVHEVFYGLVKSTEGKDFVHP